MPASLQWTPSQHTNILFCLRRTRTWHTQKRNSHILIILRDLSAAPRFCAERVYLHAVHGRLNGVARLRSVFQCHIRGSGGKERVRNMSLDTMNSPGCFCVLKTALRLGMIIRELKFVHLHPHFVLKEWVCIWTGRLVLCLSTVSLTCTDWHIYTHFTPHSLSLSMQGFVSILAL